MPYHIQISDAAFNELASIKPFYRRRIAEAVEQQLQHEPGRVTKNRKILIGLRPEFEHNEPVWELRVGLYRVYYDFSEEQMTVRVRAIREKPPHVTTEQSL